MLLSSGEITNQYELNLSDKKQINTPKLSTAISRNKINNRIKQGEKLNTLLSQYIFDKHKINTFL